MKHRTIAQDLQNRGINPQKKAPELWDSKDFEILSKLLKKRSPMAIIHKIYRLVNEHKNPYHTVLQARSLKLEINDRHQNPSN